MTAGERIAELLSEYDYPLCALEDVDKRIADFYLSGNRDDNDPYLWQQVRYLENWCKMTTIQKRAKI